MKILSKITLVSMIKCMCQKKSMCPFAWLVEVKKNVLFSNEFLKFTPNRVIDRGARR